MYAFHDAISIILPLLSCSQTTAYYLMTQGGCDKGNGDKDKAVSLTHCSQLKHTHLTHTLSENSKHGSAPGVQQQARRVE